MDTRLNGILIDRFADDEPAGYPTLCKGRFEVQGETYYALEEPTSLNSMELLPEMARLGIAAIKIEGRQRSPAYVAQVTKVWRAAIDTVKRATDGFKPLPGWMAELNKVSEGSMHTLGAYYRRLPDLQLVYSTRDRIEIFALPPAASRSLELATAVAIALELGVPASTLKTRIWMEASLRLEDLHSQEGRAHERLAQGARQHA